MMQSKIKVGFCVAYDWSLLRYAIPAVYEYADIICISLDSERKTWAGNAFDFDTHAFQKLLKEIDPLHKINLYEDDFHKPELTAGQNEVRQRNLLANQMGMGGWHIQLDCDEYFIDFKKFIDFLLAQKQTNKRFNVCCPLVTVFKKVEGGFLYIQPSHASQIEYIQIATQTPHYEYGRRNGNFNVYTNFVIIHQSWARSEAEIQQKISNWGHINDFNQPAFFANWKGLNKSNFRSWKNFHPITPAVWPQLAWQSAGNMATFISKFDQQQIPWPTAWQLLLRNSRLLSHLKAIAKLTAKGLARMSGSK